MPHHNPTHCLNCEAVITPEQAYCSRCGQKCATHRLSFHELWHDVVHYMTHADKSLFNLFGALVTLIIWLFYTRGKYSYVEHLVANMYFVSTLMVFYALVVVPFNALVHSSTLAMGMLGAFFLFELIYRGWAYYQFMGKKGARVWWKAMGVTFFTVVLWVSGTMYIISTYIRTGFK